jgi:hypothetical protein
LLGAAHVRVGISQPLDRYPARVNQSHDGFDQGLFERDGAIRLPAGQMNIFLDQRLGNLLGAGPEKTP